jgi:peroxiredoxin Q/BCP
MKLLIGQVAPLFTASDMYEQPIVLSEHRGHKVLLSFFRYATCPLCNLRIKHLIDLYPKLKLNDLQILCIFNSSKQNMLENVGSMQPPFPLIPDPDAQIYQQYGVESSKFKAIKGMLNPELYSQFSEAIALKRPSGKREGDNARIPADFLIDESGIIQQAYYGSHIGDHMPLKEIEAF